MGVQGTVQRQSDRPIPIEQLVFPPMDPRDRIEPFEAAVVMPHDVRAPEQKGAYLEAVTVYAAIEDGARVFVRFYRSGSTGWVDSDRLVDR